MTNNLDTITSLCKRRGFVYPTSEIYGGLMSSYDYGPLGTEMLRNIRNLWWEFFVDRRDDMVGIDSQILLHPSTWIASGHVASFSDPMVEDKKTHKRYRADHVIENWIQAQEDQSSYNKLIIEDMTIDDMAVFMKTHKILSPDKNELTTPKTFNLLFETKLGVIEEEKSTLYLRGETAQGIFSNFKNVVASTRIKMPFGIGQIGKAFRNEITTGQFIFRTLELEQAEIEYFFDPEKYQWEAVFKDFQSEMWKFVTQYMGIGEDKLRWREHTDKERSFYSKQTFDLEYQFPFGWKEVWGIAYRTDYDLSAHSKESGQSLEYLDQLTGKKCMPHVIEPAVGINRLLLMALCDGYVEEEKRIVLKLNPRLSPMHVAVFPLVANKPAIAEKAQTIYRMLKSSKIGCAWDDRGNIGKRYLSQDEAGTPWCITIDYQTLEDETVTVRDRDTMLQERIAIAGLAQYFKNKLE